MYISEKEPKHFFLAGLTKSMLTKTFTLNFFSVYHFAFWFQIGQLEHAPLQDYGENCQQNRGNPIE